ncbi:DNA glycosylase [Corynascus similis CBS 632.67]
MRTSRVAKDTSKYFDTTSTAIAPRRSTRASLARFAYNKGDTEVTLGSDIEDAVKTTVTRKRKRTETVTQLAPRRVSTRSTRKTTTTTTTTTTKTDVETQVKTEEPTSDADNNAGSGSETKSRPRGRVRKPARKITDATTGVVTVEPPSDWEEMYDLVKEMRLTGPAANAAVDTMGCERLADPTASPRERRFHTLVALMLSSQTKDTVNAEAMARLRTELPPHAPGARPGLTLENMLAVEPTVLNSLICKVGFHNNKTKYLKQTAEILKSKFNSDIPPTIEGLTSLPGVGPKMAHLCMSATNGWGRVEGIGVDVHVHRITNLWGWQSPPSKTPEETRHALESWLPRDRWKEINWLLVGLGQSVCLPVGRRCGECELGLRGLCKSAERGKVLEGRKRRMELKKEEVVVTKKEEDGDEYVKIKKEEVVDEAEVEEKKETDGVVNEVVAEAPLGSPRVKEEEL